MKKSKSVIPYIIFAAILSYVLLDLVFIYIADYTFTGVYTDNYYQKGVDFSRLNKQGMYQDKTGWKSTIVYNTKSNQVVFNLHNHLGQPITGAIVQAKVMLPVAKKYDSLFVLREDKPGVYKGGFRFLFPAQWDIRVKASYEGKEYIATKREFVKNL